METASVNANQLIQDLAPALSKILGPFISLGLELHQEVPALEADPPLLKQALQEIGHQARQSMPMGGTLRIRTEPVCLAREDLDLHPQGRPGAFVCIAAQDTGAGLDERTLRHIFEPFPPSTHAQTGLALSIALGIIRQHRGWIEAESSVGEGTVFRLYLPARTRPGAETRTSALVPSRAVLVVDDEPGLRRLLGHLLRKHGYVVTECASGKEALRVWKEQRPEIDLLITDMMMPGGVSGKELAEQLHRDQPELAVIFTSGYCLDEAFPLRENVHFLAKPFPPARLLELVRDTFEPRTALPA